MRYGSHTDSSRPTSRWSSAKDGWCDEPLRRRMCCRLRSSLLTDHVIGHELVHAFQFDMTTSPDGPPGRTGADRLPLWFIEGMAEYLSIGPVDSNTALWIRDAARQEKLPEIKDLNNPKYFPYRWGQALWAYIAGRFGEEVIGELLTTAAGTGDVDAAFEHVLGVKSKDLSHEWHASIHGHTRRSRTHSPPSIGRCARRQEVVSDCTWVRRSSRRHGLLFLSTMSLFSTDLYLSEPATDGLSAADDATATDPHFSISVHLLGRCLRQQAGRSPLPR